MNNSPRFEMFSINPSNTKTEIYEFSIKEDYLHENSSSKFTVVETDYDGVIIEAISNVSLNPQKIDWKTDNQLVLGRFSCEEFHGVGYIDNPYFHQSNVFAMATKTLEWFEEELGFDIQWRGGKPLTIRPHAVKELNAIYNPSDQSINFGYIYDPTGVSTWTCLYRDVVSHELGHAILDSYRPYWLYFPGSYMDIRAIHESIADLFSIFTIFDNSSLVKSLIGETKGSLFVNNFAARIAETLPNITETHEPALEEDIEGREPDPRTATADVKYDLNEPSTPHGRSLVWTCTIYEILARMLYLQNPLSQSSDAYEQDLEWFIKTGALATAQKWIERDNGKEFSDILIKSNQRIKAILFRALTYTSPAGVSMPILARLMYDADEYAYPTSQEYRKIMLKVFQERNIWEYAKNYDFGISKYSQLFIQKLNNFNEMYVLGYDSTSDRTQSILIDYKKIAKLIIDFGSEFGIPKLLEDQKGQLLQPSMKCINRPIEDKDTGGKHLRRKEYHLTYLYKISLAIKGVIPTIREFYYGGTLVFDAGWAPKYLVKHPDVLDSNDLIVNNDILKQELLSDSFEKHEILDKLFYLSPLPFSLKDHHH